MASDPDITEEPYVCQHCRQAVAMLVRQHGRALGLRVLTITGGCLLVKHLDAVCECGSPIKFSVSDQDLKQILLELQFRAII